MFTLLQKRGKDKTFFASLSLNGFVWYSDTKSGFLFETGMPGENISVSIFHCIIQDSILSTQVVSKRMGLKEKMSNIWLLLVLFAVIARVEEVVDNQ